MNNITTVAFMGKDCNSFSLFDVNIFDFSGCRTKKYNCDNKNITIIKNSTKSFKIEFVCPVCNEQHIFTIPTNQFFTNDFFSFSCPFYEAEILFIGKKGPVESGINEYMNEDLGEYESNDDLPSYSTVEKLISLTKNVEKNPHLINICNCNSTYSVAYNEKEVFIICDKCRYALPLSYDKIELFLEETFHI